jgi:hypothetical protein
MESGAAPKKSSNKLTALLNFEQEMQAKWEQEKCFEKNAEDETRFEHRIILKLFLTLTYFNHSFFFWFEERNSWSRFRIRT